MVIKTFKFINRYKNSLKKINHSEDDEANIRLMSSLKQAIEDKNSDMVRIGQNELLDKQADTITQIAFNLLDLRGFDGRRLRTRNEIGTTFSLTEEELVFLLENLNSSQVK